MQLELLKKSSLPNGFKIWFLDLDRLAVSAIVDNKINLVLPDNGTRGYRIIIGKEDCATKNSINFNTKAITHFND